MGAIVPRCVCNGDAEHPCWLCRQWAAYYATLRASAPDFSEAVRKALSTHDIPHDGEGEKA